MSASVFSLIFVLALGLTTLLKLWLSARQMRHVAQHRATVPSQFQNQIQLSSHQRAADYTLARHRFGLISLALEVLVVIGLTMFGGLQWIYDLSQSWFGHTTASPNGQFLIAAISFVVMVTAITSLIDLPFNISP